MFRRNQIRSRLLSKFNHCTLDNLANSTIFQCNKCRKYNTIHPPQPLVEERNKKKTADSLYQICLFCGQPNYTLPLTKDHSKV